MIRQLRKLEDIKKVKVLTVDECSNSEMLLVKVGADGNERIPVLKIVQAYGARVLDIGGSTITIEVTGQTHEIDEFMEQIEQFDILEMARTGINALERGDSTIHDDD